MERVRFTWLVCALTIVTGAVGCRDYTPRFHEKPHANTKGPSENLDAIHKAVPRPEPGSAASDGSDPIIAGIYLNAGCTINPEEMAVAAAHEETAGCEHVLATAYTGTNGDMDEVAAPITWTVTDWSDLTFDCIGAQHNLCAAHMTKDFFDLGATIEPGSVVTACTSNDCPANDATCLPTVCASVAIKSAINLEGAWSLDLIGEPPGLTFDIQQIGRTLFTASNDMDHAFISGFSILFDRGDYRYIGTVAPDRGNIEGYALDLISLSPAGSWSAHRL